HYDVGVRLTTHVLDDAGDPASAPARITATIGQNELVTGGRPIGAVANIEGFFPFRIKSTGMTLFLFGRGNFKVGTPVTQSTPLALSPALPAVGISDSGVV